MNEKGYIFKGQMQIKATLESDPLKSLLIEVLKNDTVSDLKRRISDKMEVTDEVYRNLRNLKVSKVKRKNSIFYL